MNCLQKAQETNQHDNIGIYINHIVLAYLFKPMVLNLFEPDAHFGTFSKFAAY